jgi:6-phosphofructokinase
MRRASMHSLHVTSVWLPANGDEVIGADGGFEGLLAGKIVTIDQSIVTLLAGRGGTVLASSRVPVLGEDRAQTETTRNYRAKRN